MTDPLAEPPFFIVGSGRSGTTLVRSLLAAHSRMAVPPETHFMQRAARHGAAAPADFESFWRDLVAWRRFRDLGVEPARVLELVDRAGRRDFRTIFAAMLRAYADKLGKPRVGEKTPGHYRHLDRLVTWFPEARFIVVHRDPRAVVASQLRSPWVAEQRRPAAATAPFMRRLRFLHIAEHAEFWMQAYGHFLADARRDPRMHVVAYEALVADPEVEVRRLCDFLGESFEPHQLGTRNGVGSASSTLAPRGWGDWVSAHEKRASSPVSADSRERWREDLSELEIGVIEAVCGPRMIELGYRPEDAGSRFSHGLAKSLLLADAAEARLRRALSGMRRR